VLRLASGKTALGAASLSPAEEQPVADDRQTGSDHEGSDLLEAFDHAWISADLSRSSPSLPRPERWTSEHPAGTTVTGQGR
jgi:hypothetical protein